MRRLGPLYGGAVALVHSTPWRWPVEVGDDARSPAWIVALGRPIGVVAWLVALLVRAAGVPAPIAALFGLAALAGASAVIIERGVADRLDRLDRLDAGHTRAGQPNAAAIVALVFLTLVRAASIAYVAPQHWLAVFVTTAVLGRWAAIFLQSIGDPIATDEQRSLVATPAPMWLTGAISAAVAVLAVFALGKLGIVAFGLSAVCVFGLGLDAQRRDGGLSSMVVAVAAAVGELTVLLVATIG